MPAPRLTLALYSLELPTYACARLRLLEPVAALAPAVRLRLGTQTDGTNYTISPTAMQGADLIVFQRYFPMERTWPVIEQALASGLPVLYDLDDNFLAVPPHHPMAASLAEVLPFAKRLMARADLVTVSTEALAEAVSGLCRRVVVLQNGIDPTLWTAPRTLAVRHAAGQEAGQDGTPKPVRVVFAGTPSHQQDLEAIAPALARMQGKYGPAMHLVLMGCDAPHLTATRLPFEPDYAAYARTLAFLRPDIGLAPLADNAFNRCKSAVKWLEYSALGAAGLYADLPPYAPVEHQRTGLKVSAAPEQWEQALDRLLDDAALRTSLGRKARAEVFTNHSVKACAEKHLRTWVEAAGKGHYGV